MEVFVLRWYAIAPDKYLLVGAMKIVHRTTTTREVVEPGHGIISRVLYSKIDHVSTCGFLHMIALIWRNAAYGIRASVAH
jgi:hypothetical protein